VAAPTGREEETTVVLLNACMFNSAYFEHAYLAQQLGSNWVKVVTVRPTTIWYI